MYNRLDYMMKYFTLQQNIIIKNLCNYQISVYKDVLKDNNQIGIIKIQQIKIVQKTVLSATNITIIVFNVIILIFSM